MEEFNNDNGFLFVPDEYSSKVEELKDKPSGKVIFKKYDQDQTYLLPPSLDDYVGKFHIARLISRIIDSIDISNIISQYKGGGTSSYHPRMLFKVWILGYIYHVYTSRRLAKMLREHTVFMWISGNQQPDFRTLNTFRKRLGKDIKSIFKEIVQLGLRIGLITGEDVFIDHTKFEADSNKHKVVWKKQVNRQLSRIEEELDILFRYIEDLNRKEDAEYGDRDYVEMERDSFNDELVGELIDKINDRVKEGEISREFGRDSRKAVRRAKELVDRKESYEKKKDILGDRNSYSKTDSDASALMMKDGVTIRPGYNEGIAVENGFVLNYEINDKASDNVNFKDIVEGVKDNIEKSPENICTDGAYGNEENYQYLEDEQINSFLKYNTYHKEKSVKWNENRFRQNAFEYVKDKDIYICPNDKELLFDTIRKEVTKTGYVETKRLYKASEEDCSKCPYKNKCTDGQMRGLYINDNYLRLKENSRENLDSVKGIEMRSRRSHEAETVFGDRKWNHGFKRFHLRGIDNVKIESGLFYSMYNIKKIYKYIMEKLIEFQFKADFLPALENN